MNPRLRTELSRISAPILRLLFAPQLYGKQPQKIFENAVNWLLSLAGFQTIYLGFEITTSKGRKKFDSLTAKESGIPIGSTDIIAFEENYRLLLVDCDIGGIDDNKIDKLLGACKRLAESSGFNKFSFVPVLCTPKECEVRTKKGVTVVDKLVLEGILEEVAKGNRKEAREKIIIGHGYVGTAL